jgi:hypothetical protein
MSSLKRKRNLLDDKQKREIISYAKENQKLTQQQIAVLKVVTRKVNTGNYSNQNN